MPRKHKLGEITKEEQKILDKVTPEEMKDLKTIPPEKWDQAKKDIHESIKHPDKMPDKMTIIYLDNDDIRELRKKGTLDYDEVRITFVKTKKSG